MRRHLTVAATVVGLLAFSAAVASAQQPLFESLTHDFGAVPRGTHLVHQFKLTNVTKSPMHVSGTRTSCGVCTSVTIGKYDLQPDEATTVSVNVDTKKFSGSRQFTIYVSFDRPFVDEARLVVTANSREDVTIEPGQIAFGRVKKGTSPKASVTVEAPTNPSFQITGVDNDNGYLQPQVTQVQRGFGAAYLLEVKLREDIPAGAWHADLWLKTNDAAAPRLRVPLIVEIESTLTATPNDVAIGQVKMGNKVERKVVLRSATPFKVTKIEGADEQIEVAGGTEEDKPVQVLKVTVHPGKEGLFKKNLKVLTSLPGQESVEFTVQANVGH